MGSCFFDNHFGPYFSRVNQFFRSDELFSRLRLFTQRKQKISFSNQSSLCLVLLFCVHNIVQTCEQYFLKWETISFCVGGVPVPKFWGTGQFSGSKLGGIIKQDPYHLHISVSSIFQSCRWR